MDDLSRLADMAEIMGAAVVIGGLSYEAFRNWKPSGISREF